MLGQPISMLIPEVVGFRLVDRLPEGATATDLVLTITERLRKLGVVGKFVEFYGPGLEFLTIADRATLGNMSPEYGATIAICPIDDMTLDYLRLTGRDEAHVQLVEAYAKEQGLFWTSESPDPVYTATCRARSLDRRAEPGRTEAAAGSRLAAPGEIQVPAGARRRCSPSASRRPRRPTGRGKARRGQRAGAGARPQRLWPAPTAPCRAWKGSTTARSSSRRSPAAPTRRTPAS